MPLQRYRKLTWDWIVLAYADDVNLLGNVTRATEISAHVLINAVNDIGLAVNIRKTQYMELGHYHDMIANEHITVGSTSYKKVKT